MLISSSFVRRFFFLLFFCYLSGISSLDTRASSIDFDEVSLGRIVISASRGEAFEGQLAENIVVLEKSDIEKLPADNLSEALIYVPGVDVDVRERFGQSSNITIHGSKSRHVLIMVDGIPFNTQLSGQVNPTKIPLDNVKRIEIIKGAASSAWGSSLGGVINVITDDVGTTSMPHGNFSTSYGEFNTFKESLKFKGKVGNTGYLMTAKYTRTDGIHSDSDTREKQIFSKIAHPLGDQAKVTASFGYSGANVHEGILVNDRFYKTPYYARYGKLQLDIDKSVIDFKIAYKYNDQDLFSDTYKGSTQELMAALSTHQQSRYHGLSLQGTSAFGDDTLVFGSDLEWHTIKSKIYLAEAKSIAIQAPYINYQMKLDNWILAPGLRYDRNDQFGNQLSPSFGAVYDFKDQYQTKLRAKVSRAFNAPPLMWIYYQNTDYLIYPNPDLKAERGMTYEIGVNSQIRCLAVDISGYWVDIDDYLYTYFDIAQFRFITENIQNVRRQGGEVTLDYALTDHFNVYGSAAYNRNVNRTTGEKIRGNGSAQHSFRLGTSYKSDNGLKLDLYGYLDRWDTNAGDEANDSKFIFDARISKEFHYVKRNLDVEFFFNIYNLTNASYWQYKNYPSPGRYVEGGVKIKF